ncbi:MAG TPA: hypothetical protein VFI02_17165 [Armatimonadota bacterium]|nr:hypothetical protein [Armatimonadota bacterium]
MKEARITIEIPGVLVVSEAVDYKDDEEESKILGFVRSKIKEMIRKNYRGLKRAAMLACLPRGLALMREITKRADKYFGWKDSMPTCWADFRCWAIRRGFLTIKELSEV